MVYRETSVGVSEEFSVHVRCPDIEISIDGLRLFLNSKDIHMSKLLGLTTSLALSIIALGCASGPEVDESGFDDLEGGLAPLGKADGLVSEITIYSNGIALRGAAARTLYNLLDADGAQSQVRSGLRTLYAANMACITNGVANYCEMRGESQAGNSSYEALIHGEYSAAGTLYDLLAQGSDDSFVSTPWFACEDVGSGLWCGIEASKAVTISFDSLEDSGNDFVYEGWAIFDGVPTTTGRFTAGSDIVQRIPLSITTNALYVLTIEPRRGDAPEPSATHLLAGPLEVGGTTDLTTEHPAALGTDFANASGGYILATPSSVATDDDNQGIWFVNPVAGAATLDLPTLPNGWVYEGWVVTENGPVSTGRFTEVAGADSDGAGPSAGPEMTPPFPGQDFISPAIDLLGKTIVISVEPEPDNAATPFAIKPLIDPAVEEVAKPERQALGNTSEKRPSAVASF